MGRPISTAGIATWLYLLAASLLFSPIGNHPPFAYNWEQYTAWRVFAFWYDGFRPADVFAVTDGLMTDSGQGPIVGLPVWLGFHLLSPSILAMRAPVMLVAALAAPLSWLVGRRLVGGRAALLAALLLAISPAWLLYGRTATQVGISLVPMLLTVYILLDVLDGGARWRRSLVLLQIALVTGIYAYAPIRFLWPIALGLLTLQAMSAGARRDRVALAVTASTLPLALLAIGQLTAPDAAATDALVAYYNARGEQVVGLHYQPEQYGQYIDVRGDDATRSSEVALAGRLVLRNAATLGRLLIDDGTGPALTNFDNPADQPVGRLYPALLFPFLLLGSLAAARSVWNGRWRNDLVLLVLASGFTMPMLLTSRVHIGRLIFALPFIFLLVARGAVGVASLTQRRVRGVAPGRCVAGRRMFIGLSMLLVASVAWSAIAERSAVVPEPRAVRMAATMAPEAPAAASLGGAVFLTSDLPTFEAVHLAEVRLYLDDDFDFVDLRDSTGSTPVPSRSGRPALYFGGLLERGLTSAGLRRCPGVVFLDRIDIAAVPRACISSSRIVVLPD